MEANCDRIVQKYHAGAETRIEGFKSLGAHIPPCFAPFLCSNLQQTCLFLDCTWDSAPLVLLKETTATEEKNNFDWQSTSASKNSTIRSVQYINAPEEGKTEQSSPVYMDYDHLLCCSVCPYIRFVG